MLHALLHLIAQIGLLSFHNYFLILTISVQNHHLLLIILDCLDGLIPHFLHFFDTVAGDIFFYVLSSRLIHTFRLFISYARLLLLINFTRYFLQF